MSELLMAQHHPCSRCHRLFLLLARIGTALLCADCWREEGEPMPPRCTVLELGRWEAEVRHAMNRRGGDTQNAVRKGA